ncbi:DUF2322 family protein [Pasteurellaceae bacterium HPA106]|uniref:DUF2322 family protein n=1 Tax=Spirabiliibacterium pneumoniae TaxID=221400 RepID=UPI001AADAF72|nr:DUF2322 family protein [Spirabiliibacterium pneumoniae]MBE2896045.1 DUF2322 family protein [Spirabiliibacterium pneumoniae]
MNFQQTLATLASVEHLKGLIVLDKTGETVLSIPAIEGKLGSLKVYNTLAMRFTELNSTAAKAGLILFAEHVDDAKRRPGAHPNIDFLLQVVEHDLCFKMQPLSRR